MEVLSPAEEAMVFDAPAIVCLDVDGVVSPFAFDAPAWPDFQDLHSLAPLSPAMGAAIAARWSAAQLVWVTTWGDHANDVVGEFFDWPALPATTPETAPDAEAVADDGLPIWWKARWVRRIAELNPASAIVWIDDEIDGRDWAEELRRVRSRVTIVCPPRDDGLSPQLVAHVGELIDQAVTAR
jgi:hypothetical protein